MAAEAGVMNIRRPALQKPAKTAAAQHGVEETAQKGSQNFFVLDPCCVAKCARSPAML